MDLILWRHAEAESGEPDYERALNLKGRKQAMRMAGWLNRNLPNSCRILTSPAIRAIQTAEALGRKFKVIEELAPDTTAPRILTAVNWPESREPVLVVGHQPSLGQVAALLMSGKAEDWAVRKGNAWWISQRRNDDLSTNYLRAVISPDLVMK